MSEAWYEEQMAALVAQVQEVLGRSKSLRESSHLNLIQARNEQTASRDAVRYSLRKSVHRLDQAVHDLLSQRDTLETELAALVANIGRTEDQRRHMTYPMRLAHTRLENRLDRPERCHDLAQRSLESQVETVGAAFDAIDQRLDRSRSTRMQLEQHLSDVRNELNRKTAALDIDRKCLDVTDRFVEARLVKDVTVGPRYPNNFPIPISFLHS